MTLETRIEEISKDQLPAMVKIWNQHRDVLTDDERRHDLASLTRWHETCHEINNKMFGISAHGELKGFMILHYEEDAVWLKMTAILRGEMGKGYGSALFTFGLEEAGDRNIYTEVKIKNFETLNILLSKQFRIVKFRKDHEEYVLKYAPEKS